MGVTSCDYAIVVVGRGFGCDLFCPWCHLLNLFVALTHCKDSIKTHFYFLSPKTTAKIGKVQAKPDNGSMYYITRQLLR